MTLIAAGGTPEGIVIHADSQETVGDYRVQVDKIKCEAMGRFDVLIAGAGSPSSLVNAFPLRLSRRITDKISTLAAFAKKPSSKNLPAFTDMTLRFVPTKERMCST